jgi:F-type H+-transporting ATPase subunit epsilon
VALEVRVVTPEREIWSGQAEMVIAHGVEGDVGILQGHAPLLIRLTEGTVRVQTGGGEERIPVAGGFLHVTSDEGSTRVDVLADASSAGASG